MSKIGRYQFTTIIYHKFAALKGARGGYATPFRGVVDNLQFNRRLLIKRKIEIINFMQSREVQQGR